MDLGDLVSKSASELGIRFILVGVLPTTLLALLVLFLLWAGAPAEAPKLTIAIAKVEQLDTATGLILIVAILGLVVILQPFQLFLVRILEGYWGASKLASAIGKAFIDRQRNKRDSLKSDLDKLLKVAGGQISDSQQGLRAKAAQLADRLFSLLSKG